MSEDPTRIASPLERQQREGTAETLEAPGAGEARRLLPHVDRGAYAVGEEVARGGLGRIVQAVDRRLDRPVAIKELLEVRRGADYEARFAREALLTARLQHPAIVPVYEAGVWEDGSPFYAMKLVSGKSLEAAVRERATLAERLELLPHVIDVVEALAYAHERRIIHRDLKPANVLVGAYGETVVIDWGLAKDLGEGIDLDLSARRRRSDPEAAEPRGQTIAGSVLGTPAYMPPEQALGMSVDERADVYALGALLYHVLGGAPPYSGVSSEHILTCVIRDPPDPLLEKEPAVPPDLHAIVLKAMAREVEDRYRTAAELAADLNRWQRGQLVVAHRYSRATLLARWLRRNRAPVVVGTAMLALLVAVAVIGFRRVVAERDVARAERAEAQRLRIQADTRGDELALREAEALVGRDPRAALGWLTRLSPESGAMGAARVVATDALAHGVPTRVAAVAAYALAFSPDGALLAMARAGDVLLDDVQSGQRLVLAGRGGDERALAFSPRGGRLAFAGLGGSLRLWDRATGAPGELPGHGADVVALAWASEDVLASVARDGTLRLTRVGGGAERRLIAAHQGEATEVAARAGLVATGGGDGQVRLWSADSDDDRPLASLRHEGRVRRLAFSDDGRRLAALGEDGALRVWDVATREGVLAGRFDEPGTALVWWTADLIAVGDKAGVVWVWDIPRGRARRLGAHEDGILALATAGDLLLSGGRDHVVRLWNPDGSGRVLAGHTGDILALAASGQWIASASRDRSVRLWRRDEGQAHVVAIPRGAARGLAASVDGAQLAGATDGDLWRWDLGQPAARALVATGPFSAVAMTPDGSGIAAGTEDGRVLLFSAGTTPAPLGTMDGPVAHVAFDLRGRLCAAAGRGGLRVFDVAAGRERFADATPVTALAFSPGGSLLATAGEAVRLWDVDRGTFRALAGGPFSALAFSSDGHRLAGAMADGVLVWTVGTAQLRRLAGPGVPVERLLFAGDERLVGVAADRSVRVWELAGDEARSLAGLTGVPSSLAVSPDGRSVAVGSTDGSVRLWDVGSGRGRSLLGHQGAVTGLAFADGGRALASAAADGTLRLWPDELPHERSALRVLLEMRAPKE